MNLEKIWQSVKPVSISVIALVGIFQDIIFDKDISSILFIMIIGLSFLFRGKSIIEGIKEIGLQFGNKSNPKLENITKKGSAKKHVGPRPPVR